ncbi:hypothetical protein BCV70DRAFT_63368 [Testicularia cyperi]|uniref:Uncharacterized protein n=1 Tax=Testicularia cyperi TaxID=1882483 RepID=A0A317XVQ8_9BASI|nr:hypothetical protein BCV70DRAFT_63368 [Testicularia cyperi]
MSTHTPLRLSARFPAFFVSSRPSFSAVPFATPTAVAHSLSSLLPCSAGLLDPDVTVLVLPPNLFDVVPSASACPPCMQPSALTIAETTLLQYRCCHGPPPPSIPRQRSANTTLASFTHHT